MLPVTVTTQLKLSCKTLCTYTHPKRPHPISPCSGQRSCRRTLPQEARLRTAARDPLRGWLTDNDRSFTSCALREKAKRTETWSRGLQPAAVPEGHHDWSSSVCPEGRLSARAPAGRMREHSWVQGKCLGVP